MGMFQWLSDWWSGIGSDVSSPSSTSNFDSASMIETTEINPATGLPMIGGIGGMDVEGNPYGTDMSSHHDICSSSSIFDDPWNPSCSSLWDDSSMSSSTSCGSSWDD
jgi:hypothetical protein